MTRPDIAAIRERCAKATLNVFWGRIPETEEPDTSIICGPNGFYARVVGYPGQPSQNDAEFWTRARADVPALLAYIEALEGVVREYGFRHVKFCPRHPDSVGNNTPQAVCQCGLIDRLTELGLEK